MEEIRGEMKANIILPSDSKDKSLELPITCGNVLTKGSQFDVLLAKSRYNFHY